MKEKKIQFEEKPREAGRKGGDKKGEQEELRKEPAKTGIGLSAAQLTVITFAVAAVAIIIFFFFFFVLRNPGVPFPTFKANFGSAQRIAVVASYYNQSQYVAVANCATKVLYAITVSGRNASTIDLFFLNQMNSTCTFSKTIYPVNITTDSANYCLGIANSEPSVFLTYGQVNSTQITAYKLSVYGNSAYMGRCPVAVDMS